MIEDDGASTMDMKTDAVIDMQGITRAGAGGAALTPGLMRRRSP